VSPLQSSKPASQLAYFSGCAAVSRYIQGLEATRDVYTALQRDPYLAVVHDRGTGMLSEENRALYEPLAAMQSVARRFVGHGTRDSAVLAMYWLMPPRRLEPQHVRITQSLDYNDE